jgi:cytochrome c oxidase subunit 4
VVALRLTTYFLVLVALMLTTLLEVALVLRPPPGLPAPSLVLGLAGLKALLIALYYQHLRYEPARLAYIPLASLLPVAALTLALLLTYPMPAHG